MTNGNMSPLRRRMTEDMTIRGFTAGTQRGYLAAVENFTAFLGRPPDRSDARGAPRLLKKSDGNRLGTTIESKRRRP